MPDYQPRSRWTSSDAAGSALVAPVGVAVHWPGGLTRYAGASESRIASTLEGFRRFHVFTNGWADIAYQVAIDQSGRVWDLRGTGRRSAANGDGATNSMYGAVLFLLGPGEDVSPEMAAAFVDWRRDRWLARWPYALLVTTHGAVRPGGTACPGPAATEFVAAESWRLPPAPTPTPDPEDDDMPLTEREFGRLSGDMLRQANKAVKPVLARLGALEAVIRAETPDGPELIELARQGAAQALADVEREG